jgi:hypothetical protein
MMLRLSLAKTVLVDRMSPSSIGLKISMMIGLSED